MIRQMKYYLIAVSAWNIVRAFLHSFNHGYDVLFELRMLAAVIPLCFAALIVVIVEALKPKTDDLPFVEVPYFQSLGMAPAPETMNGRWIYIKDYARLYRSDGVAWIPVEAQF